MVYAAIGYSGFAMYKFDNYSIDPVKIIKHLELVPTVD